MNVNCLINNINIENEVILDQSLIANTFKIQINN